MHALVAPQAVVKLAAEQLQAGSQNDPTKSTHNFRASGFRVLI